MTSLNACFTCNRNIEFRTTPLNGHSSESLFFNSERLFSESIFVRISIGVINTITERTVMEERCCFSLQLQPIAQ